jgi:hypothetical protein
VHVDVEEHRCELSGLAIVGFDLVGRGVSRNGRISMSSTLEMMTPQYVQVAKHLVHDTRLVVLQSNGSTDSLL